MRQARQKFMNSQNAVKHISIILSKAHHYQIKGSYQLDFQIISPLMSVLTTLKHKKWFERQKLKISSKGSKDKQKFIFK